VVASANRDERQFENPDKLDITRDPNRHLAFCKGIHHCLVHDQATSRGMDRCS